jgi:hypothetical protein
MRVTRRSSSPSAALSRARRGSRVSLLKRERFGNDADLLAAERIQAFPEPSLGTAVSPEPFFAASGGAAGVGFRDRRRGRRS